MLPSGGLLPSQTAKVKQGLNAIQIDAGGKTFVHRNIVCCNAISGNLCCIAAQRRDAPRMEIAMTRIRSNRTQERVSPPPRFIEKEVKDRIVKTGKRIVTAALGGALCLATSIGLSAAASRSPATMKPLMATSLDVGSKHVVSYFLNADGQCKLTLMIADAARDENSEPSAQILRLRLMVEPGKAALVDTTDGRLLQFACERDAQAMNATLLDQIAAGHDIK